MGVFYDPLSHSDVDPKSVDAKGNQSEEPPFDVVAKELCCCAVECQTPAFNVGVVDFPFFD